MTLYISELDPKIQIDITTRNDANITFEQVQRAADNEATRRGKAGALLIKANDFKRDGFGYYQHIFELF